MAVETVRYSIYHSVNSDSSQEPFDFELHSSVGCARLTRLFKYLVLYPSSVKYNRSLEGPCTYISDLILRCVRKGTEREQDVFRGSRLCENHATDPKKLLARPCTDMSKKFKDRLHDSTL